MTPAAILFALAGSPAQDGCGPVEGSGCRVCGAQDIARGVPYTRFGSASFTGQCKLRH